jgi:hypothetical protein
VESINWEIETSCKKLSGEKDDMRCLTMQWWNLRGLKLVHQII